MAADYANDLEFSKLLAGRDDVELVGLMLEIAADAYTELDREACRDELDRLGRAAAERMILADRDTIESRLGSISRVLYCEEGFRGNTDDYYNPRNSYLNEVLDRRLGIPISLGLVYMAVAARAGILMHGISTPGHFMVAAAGDERTVYVDPFDTGTVLDREGCRRRVEAVLGQSGVVGDEHFRPATPRDIALRTLRNLKAAYVMDNCWQEALPVQQRLSALLPHVLEENRDLGLMYLRCGSPHLAIGLLEGYLQQCRAEEAEELQPFVRSARRMLAELN